MLRPQDQKSELKLLIVKGREQGYLTYAEVNDILPDDIVDPEQIEDIISMINDMGIEVPVVAPDTEITIVPETRRLRRKKTPPKKPYAALSALDSVSYYHHRPVRMCMRGWNYRGSCSPARAIAIA